MEDNLIGHGIIDYLFVFFMLIYAYYAGITKPHRILYILPACVSCFFFLPFGSNLTADKLVPAIFIISVMLSKGSSYFSVSKTQSNSWLGKLWLLIAFSSIIGFLYSSYYSQYTISPLIKTRLIIQVIGYVNAILILVIVRKEISKLNGKTIFIKSFLITTTILCVYGFYQYFAHQFGIPYRGLVRSVSSVGTAEFSDLEDMIFRVNSFASEPKRLTYFLVLSLILLLKYQVKIIKKINPFWFFLVLIFHCLILWWTYSTSIYISIGVFILLLMLYVLFISFNKNLFRQLFFLLILGISTYFYQKNYFDSIYELRVNKQLEREEVRAEVKGQEFIINYPDMFILGIGPGIYNFALYKEYPGEAGLAGGFFLIPFNSALMTYIYDFGVIGFLILLYPFIEIVLNSKLAATNEFSIFIIFLYCTCIVLNPTPTLFLFLGAFEGVKLLEE